MICGKSSRQREKQVQRPSGAGGGGTILVSLNKSQNSSVTGRAVEDKSLTGGGGR